jgi:hypothetical protein
MMILDDLLAEGTALARPCFTLSEIKTERLAGYRGGERSDDPNTLPPEATAIARQEHIITIDPALFADLGLYRRDTPFGVFRHELAKGGVRALVRHGSLMRFSDINFTGTPLYATEDSSFPPFDAVCLYGSREVEAWLRSHGLQRHQYAEASALPVARAYAAEWPSRHPFYKGSIDAIVGGWHMMWPEDDFYLPLEMRLLLTTIRDAEPFLEIWVSSAGNLSVKSRIT